MCGALLVRGFLNIFISISSIFSSGATSTMQWNFVPILFGESLEWLSVFLFWFHSFLLYSMVPSSLGFSLQQLTHTHTHGRQENKTGHESWRAIYSTVVVRLVDTVTKEKHIRIDVYIDVDRYCPLACFSVPTCVLWRRTRFATWMFWDSRSTTTTRLTDLVGHEEFHDDQTFYFFFRRSKHTRGRFSRVDTDISTITAYIKKINNKKLKSFMSTQTFWFENSHLKYFQYINWHFDMEKLTRL